MSSLFQRAPLFLTFALLVGSFTVIPALSACGGEDEDPIPGLCQKQCEVDAKDACFSKKGDCLAGCEQVAYAVYKTGFKPVACAQCFIEKISYSKDPANTSTCWGVVLDGKGLAHADMSLPACQAVCKDPNA